MRLRKVSVRKLFGVFDHDVAFADGENVAIIHGPNGFGKTVMLRMTAALVNGNTSIFENTPFSEFWLDFDDGSRRGVERHVDTTTETSKSEIRVLRVDPNGTRRKLDRPASPPKKMLDEVDRYIPLPRMRDGWRDQTGRLLSLEDVLETFPQVRARIVPKYADVLDRLAMEDFKVFFVETNRLFGSQRFEEHYVRSYYDSPNSVFYAPRPDVPTTAHPLRVVEYSADLVQRINSVLASYGRHSQERDRTFPERLVQFLRANRPALTEREIIEQMDELEESRQRLIKLGFIDTEQGLSGLTEDDVKRAADALTIYVGDVREKLKVFDDLAIRVGMLTGILNERFKYKTMSVDREHGLRLQSSAGAEMAVSNLSSGEQHELVLLYELLFKVPKNGLVLIDEPEISLHVAWQSRFLKDLLDIFGVTHSHAIIATHAPAIIGTRWDLTIQLKGPSTEEVDDAR